MPGQDPSGASALSPGRRANWNGQRPTQRHQRETNMQLRTLGRSGLKVSALAFGGNVFGWTADEATSMDILDRFGLLFRCAATPSQSCGEYVFHCAVRPLGDKGEKLPKQSPFEMYTDESNSRCHERTRRMYQLIHLSHSQMNATTMMKMRSLLHLRLS